jgi:Cytosine specific DNA methyltransferase replication foci domain
MSACVLSGALYPITGKAAKAEGRRMRQRFGPIKSWKAIYGSSEPELVVSTELADYTIMTCAPEFREHYNDVCEQIAVCHSIVQAMKGKDAKDAQESTFESVLAAVGRAKAVKGYMSVRDAVLLNGSFILAQVPVMQAVLGSASNLEKSNFITGLKAEVCQSALYLCLSVLLHVKFNAKSICS